MGNGMDVDGEWMQCAHEGCRCPTTEDGSDFCGDHCRTHEADEVPQACACGHPECQAPH